MADELSDPGAGRAPRGVVGLGTDVVDLERFRRVLERTPSLESRAFTEAERATCRRRRDPVPGLAGRFAVKEAVLKALGSGLGDAALAEIEVVRAESGEPHVVLHGGAAELAAARGVEGWMVSITHSELVAVATVLALA